MNANIPATEPLTDEMIRALRDEAEDAGDYDLSDFCEDALTQRGIDEHFRRIARSECASAINAARAMDDETPFVRVVP